MLDQRHLNCNRCIDAPNGEFVALHVPYCCLSWADLEHCCIIISSYWQTGRQA